MGGFDVEIFLLTVSEVLEIVEDELGLTLEVLRHNSENHGRWGQKGAIRTILH